jgi:hypothetical protein
VIQVKSDEYQLLARHVDVDIMLCSIFQTPLINGCLQNLCLKGQKCVIGSDNVLQFSLKVAYSILWESWYFAKTIVISEIQYESHTFRKRAILFLLCCGKLLFLKLSSFIVVGSAEVVGMKF